MAAPRHGLRPRRDRRRHTRRPLQTQRTVDRAAHPGRGSSRGLVVEIGAETVDVSIVVHVHGRGVLRPLAAVFALFAGGRLRKEFSSSVRTLADDVAALNREMLESAGPALTPDSVADHLFAGFLESIATNRPDA